MKRAISSGINTPNIMAASYVNDKYLFRYIIMDYIDGQEASKVLVNYSSYEKLGFVHRLKDNLNKLNSKP